ncbi:hypothetical protein TALC_00884 [Thermoplasmatales archaeon BRNA1]|nr:hypothetical protein TALC_00884 [Thermoplasmatales archaeon BRNA1]
MSSSNDTDTAIIFASSLGGHVRKTAKYIAEKLGCDIFDLKLQTNIDVTAYDRVIFGTGIHAGRPYSKVSNYIADHRADLSSKKTALFICCLYKGERGEQQCQDIAGQFGISDAVFFPDSGEKNEAGVSKDADSFIERMGA